ncbi:MAG: PAS domain-containing protein [Kiritimatiellae bacterium]|nr:PAS domain-containing protein [Kiritimatiellia bacterium]
MRNFFDKVAGRLEKLEPAVIEQQYRMLAREAGFFEGVLGSLEEGVVALNADGTVLYANDAAGEMLSFDPARAKGRKFSAECGLREVETPPAKPTVANSKLQSANYREIEVAYPRRRILEVRTLLQEHGTIMILRDVTHLRDRESEMVETSRLDAVRELASGVAHEIGNPLNALSLNVQLFKRTVARIEDGRLREALAADAEAMGGEIQRLDGIVKKFLQALRPVKADLAPGSVAEPLKEMLTTMKPLFETHRVKVTLDLPPSIDMVMLDGAQMAQVFFNLAKNALEAMKDGGRLEIAVTCGDSDVCVAFRDTGEGMDEATLGRLFSAHHTTKEHGSGLGLAISQRIVRAHGGTIDVETKKGKGTVFSVRLPRINKRIRELT